MERRQILAMRVKLEEMLRMFQLVQAQDQYNCVNMFFKFQLIRYKEDLLKICFKILTFNLLDVCIDALQQS